MKRTAALAAAFLWTLAAPALAKDKEKPVKTLSEIEQTAAFSLPEGWSQEKSSGADPYVRLSKGRHVIRIRLLGGPGSAKASPEAFLESPAAGTAGRPPEVSGEVKVAGQERKIYRHQYGVDLGDPHAKRSAPGMAEEQYVLVPAGKRFFVLSYAYESAVPSANNAGEKAWEAFLAGFTLK